MPESRIRRKKAYTAPVEKSTVQKPNNRFFVPIMVTLLVVGLAWIVVYYLTETDYPIPGIGHINLIIGFGVMLTGFAMSTRWR